MTARRIVVALAAVLLAACSSGNSGKRAVLTEPPMSTDFPALADAVDLHCGSLDCHGKVGRNLRLYGRWGLRLSPADVPGCGTATTDENAEDYWSLVGLEPELTAAVFGDHGANPQRLTLIRKARGTEAHKGGTVFPEGSPGDVCLTSFVAGSLDAGSCRSLLQRNNFGLVPRCATAASGAVP
jgi:hypothetical protein